jgi:hypothetical protein
MPDRPTDARDVNPARIVYDPLLREIAEMLAYLDLHLGRHPWKQLTTKQKELLADLIDSDHVLDEEHDYSPGNEPWFVARWWREDWVQPDPESMTHREPDPFVGRDNEMPSFKPPVQTAVDLARVATMGSPQSSLLIEDQIAVYEWALTQAQPLTRTDGLTGRWHRFPSLTQAREFLAEYRSRREKAWSQR